MFLALQQKEKEKQIGTKGEKNKTLIVTTAEAPVR